MTMALAACTSGESAPEVGGNYGSGGTAVDYREPVKLSSRDGVLEVRLSAHQEVLPLDTASAPVSNFLLFGYEVIRGTASDGSTSARDVYPAPRLRVKPGERWIINYGIGIA